MPKIKKHCIVCNTIFYVWPAFDRLKCCSRKCSNLSKRGRKLTATHRKKLSVIAKQKGFGKWMLGKKATNKTRKKMKLHNAKYWKGKKLSKKHRKRLSESHKGITKKEYKPISINGYLVIRNHTHPFRTKQNYILISHLVMEEKLGRYLKPEEVVHHINGIITDNRPKNLKLFPNIKAHRQHHIKA